MGVRESLTEDAAFERRPKRSWNGSYGTISRKSIWTGRSRPKGSVARDDEVMDDGAKNGKGKVLLLLGPDIAGPTESGFHGNSK